MGKRLEICSRSHLRKVSKRKNPCEDRISCLPDEILYFIQSLLDYKKVAQMSILSRRWLNLWMHAPVLHFGAPILLDLHLRAPIVPDGRNQKPECDKFISTISRVSDGRDQRRKCDLHCHWICDVRKNWICDVRNQTQECDKSAFWMTCHAPDGRNQKGECDKIVNWMSRVSQMLKGQNSNELRVSYTLYKCYKKEDTDSNCWWEHTLAGEFQSLELNFLSNDDDCQDSSYVFPDRFLSLCSDCLSWALSSVSLGSHFLDSSGFKSLKSLSLNGVLICRKSIDLFLFSCPFLERLEVVNSPIMVDFKIKNGQSLALKYLKIEGRDVLNAFYITNCNIVSIKISDPLFLGLRQLPMLKELAIDFTPDKSRTVFEDPLCHPQLETLTLSCGNPKIIAELSVRTSQLTKLKRLVINVNASGDKSLRGLISLINACPRLEEFVLTLNWTKPRRSSRTLKKKAKRCSLKRLKVVEFLGYYGRVSDVELIVHLMENADNVEKVIIDPWNPKHMEHRYEEEAEARSLALQQLKEYVPPLVELIIR